MVLRPSMPATSLRRGQGLSKPKAFNLERSSSLRCDCRLHIPMSGGLMDGFQIAGRVEDIVPGTGRIVQVNGKAIALFNVEGRFYAISNTCPHEGGPLG